MKKVLIILMMLFTSSFIFAQKFNESERLKNGDITLFDDYISDLSLAKMDNAELRILRNMIYAKCYK